MSAGEKLYIKTPLVDVMEGAYRIEKKIHEHGLVALVDVMPRLVPQGKTADLAVVQAARVSVGEGSKGDQEDANLIRYMMSGAYQGRCPHSSPFEMVEFKFHMVLPIFVARQLIRHRTANVNEFSARYSEMKDRFFIPTREQVRAQSKSNKQGGEEWMGAREADDFIRRVDSGSEDAYGVYKAALDDGVAREMARIGMPLCSYTEWYWKVDLHNLMHFLNLRMDHHAQKEIRDYADAVFDLIRPIVPVSAQAFLDYKFDALMLSANEVYAIRTGREKLGTENKREEEAFRVKRIKLFGDEVK